MDLGSKRSPLGAARAACFEQLADVFASCGAIKRTVAGIYDLRRLQIKRSGRLGQRAVLALDCCPSILLFVQVTSFFVNYQRVIHKILEYVSLTL